jgi:hypothetical protein
MLPLIARNTRDKKSRRRSATTSVHTSTPGQHHHHHQGGAGWHKQAFAMTNEVHPYSLCDARHCITRKKEKGMHFVGNHPKKVS